MESKLRNRDIFQPSLWAVKWYKFASQISQIDLKLSQFAILYPVSWQHMKGLD